MTNITEEFTNPTLVSSTPSVFTDCLSKEFTLDLFSYAVSLQFASYLVHQLIHGVFGSIFVLSVKSDKLMCFF